MDERIEVKYLPLWSRYLDMFEESELTDSQLGRLVRMMMEYQFRGRAPESVPKGLRLAWSFVRKDLDDARGQYELRVQNGKKGGRGKKTSKTENNREKPKETEENRQKVISMSTSKSISKSMSTSRSKSKEIGSAPAAPEGDAGVCLEKKSYGEFGWVKLTDRQYRELEASMGAYELRRCIDYIDQSAQSNGNRNRWKDWYLIVRRCHENRWHEIPGRKEEIPKGGSGVLGPIELDAIQKLLRE